MKYFVYTRKSTESDEKQALSIPAQVRELNEFANKQQCYIYELLEESKSASKPNNRPVFSEMINRIKEGECSRILCWHTNRLSRNPMESGIIMQMLADGEIEEILTPQKSITNENANDILLGVEFGANSQFSKELSINTKRGLKQKVLRGEWPTYAPPFYINCKTGKGTKNIKPCEENYIYYERLVDEIIAKKLPLDSAHKVLFEWGVKSKRGRPFSRNTVIRSLRNPVYYGGLVYKDMEEQKGKWQPLISKDKWLLLQETLDSKSKPIRTKHNHPFRKQITCTKCGYTIVPYTKTKKSGKSYSYYGCSKRGGNCNNSPIRAKDLEEQILLNLKKIQLDQKTLEYLKEESAKRLDKELDYEFRKVDEIAEEYKDVSGKLDSLLKMRINKELTKEEYLNAKQPLIERQKALEDLRGDVKYNREDVKKQLELFFEKCFEIEDLFVNGTSEEKSELVSALSENLTLYNMELGWNFKKPWSHMISVNIEDKNFDWGGWWEEFGNYLLSSKLVLSTSSV
jgi:site-specific DNA recombinase